MKCVTYNTRYGLGRDGKVDLDRTADAVRGADVIALQEVTRNNPENGGLDMVSELKNRLPDYYCAFGAPFTVDMGAHLVNGRAIEVDFEFGNLILARTPILASRNLLLPRRRTYGTLDLQRAALEALIVSPLGPLRFYCVHLDHTSPDERIAQIGFLLARAGSYEREGGAVSGVSERGFSEPPHPAEFVLLGDFNMVPGSEEYIAVTGRPDEGKGIVASAFNPADAGLGTAAQGIATWIDPETPNDPTRHKRIDYCFVHAALAPRVVRSWVDTEAAGSDHRPVWIEFQ